MNSASLGSPGPQYNRAGAAGNSARGCGLGHALARRRTQVRPQVQMLPRGQVDVRAYLRPLTARAQPHLAKHGDELRLDLQACHELPDAVARPATEGAQGRSGPLPGPLEALGLELVGPLPERGMALDEIG